MEKEEFETKLKNGMKALNIELSQKQTNQFYQYMQLLIEWNQKINLTAITKPEEIIQKHFIDSAIIIKNLENTKTLIDVGTGAGFPGIPIKIIKPEIEIVLLDSLNKRIKFLEEIIQKLELKNIKAIHARAEEVGRNKEYREAFDAVVSRAVANMTTLSEYTIPLIKVGGKAIYMKSSEIEEELENAKKAIKILGGKIQKVEEIYLPGTDLKEIALKERNIEEQSNKTTEIKRKNIIIEKQEKTNNKYPRNSGKIKKEPIQ